MKMFKIMRLYTINGKESECLCDTKTATGDRFYTYDEEYAKARVAELKAIGYTSARYDVVKEEEKWWNDPTNF